MPNKICVYAICKNESKNVEKWVQSMSEADSIVVLDTGSTDDTVKKLMNLGVKVERKLISPWSFADARNEAMKLIPEDCNIFVSTDLDEYFEPGWAKPLRENWIDGYHNLCVYTYFIRPEQTILYNKIHGPGYHWKFKVHEMLVKDHEDGVLNELFLKNEIVLHHNRDASKDRSSYVELLKERFENDKKDIICLIYLINEYYAYGKINEIIEILDNYDFNLIEDKFFRLALMKTKSQCYIDKNEYDKAIECLNYCLDINDSYRELYYLLTKCYPGNTEMCYKILMEGIEKTSLHGDWFEREEFWKSGAYYDLLSLNAFYCGKIFESFVYAGMALKLSPDDERLKYNLNSIMPFLTDSEILKNKNQNK